jgi:mannosyltransferase
MSQATTPVAAAPDAAYERRDQQTVQLVQQALRLVGTYRLLLVGICLLALVLRLWGIGQRSLWLDELSALAATAIELQDFLVALSVDANMTLYYWLLFVWLQIVGVGSEEALLRLPSAVAGVAAIPLIYVLGRRLHSRAAGVAAAALLAVNGFHVIMSQEARSYALLGTLTILSYLALDGALESGRRRDWVLHGVATALSFYCHSFTIFTVVAQGVFVVSRRSRAALLGLIGSGILMALLLAQLVPFLIRQSSGAKLSRLLPPGVEDGLNLLVAFSGGSHGAVAAYLALAALGAFVAGPGTRGRAYRNWMVLTWLLVPVALALAISVVQPILQIRYLFAILPALTLVAGIGLAGLPRPAGMATFAVIAALSLISIQAQLKGLGVRGNDDWRQAVSHALSNAQPGDGWIFVSKKGQSGFEYYAHWHWGRNPAAPYTDILEPFDWWQGLNDPMYEWTVSIRELEQFAAGHARIWVVQSHHINRATGQDLALPARDWLSDHGYQANEQVSRRLDGVQLRFYERAGHNNSHLLNHERITALPP